MNPAVLPHIHLHRQVTFGKPRKSPEGTTVHATAASKVRAACIGTRSEMPMPLKCVAADICGSDQHMVRGRTTAPVGQTVGLEIPGEVVEVGEDVLNVKVDDICSVPFSIACGRCRMCTEGKTPGICLNVNPARRIAETWGVVDVLSQMQQLGAIPRDS